MNDHLDIVSSEADLGVTPTRGRSSSVVESASDYAFANLAKKMDTLEGTVDKLQKDADKRNKLETSTRLNEKKLEIIALLKVMPSALLTERQRKTNLHTAAKEYMVLSADDKSFQLPENQDLSTLTLTNKRFNTVLTNGYQQIHNSLNKTSWWSYISTDPKITAYRSVKALSPTMSLAVSNDEKALPELANMLDMIGNLTIAFHAISQSSQAEPALQNLLMEVVIEEMAELKKANVAFMGVESKALKALGNALMIMGVAMMIAIAAVMLLPLLGVSMPAVVVSWMATLNATFLVTQAVSAVTTLAASVGVQLSAANATAATAVWVASHVTLFGAATRVLGGPSKFKQQLDQAADDISAAAKESVKSPSM